MVKRAAPLNKNLWAIPGGMLELGETLQEGAEREIFEETNILIKAGNPVFTFDLLERDKKGRVYVHRLVPNAVSYKTWRRATIPVII